MREECPQTTSEVGNQEDWIHGHRWARGLGGNADPAVETLLGGAKSNHPLYRVIPQLPFSCQGKQDLNFPVSTNNVARKDFQKYVE